MVDSHCVDTALAMLAVAAAELIEDVHSKLLDATDIRPAAWLVRAESLASAPTSARWRPPPTCCSDVSARISRAADHARSRARPRTSRAR